MPIYDFKCEACEGETQIICSHADIPDPMICEHCQSPKTSRLYGLAMVRSTYDQNGRHAIKSNFGGKSTYISKTKDNYERNGDSTSQYTKGYKEHMKKKGTPV